MKKKTKIKIIVTVIMVLLDILCALFIFKLSDMNTSN